MTEPVPPRLHRTLPSPRTGGSRVKTNYSEPRMLGVAQDAGLERCESGYVMSTLRSLSGPLRPTATPSIIPTGDARLSIPSATPTLPTLNHTRFVELSATRRMEQVGDVFSPDIPLEPRTHSRGEPLYRAYDGPPLGIAGLRKEPPREPEQHFQEEEMFFTRTHNPAATNLHRTAASSTLTSSQPIFHRGGAGGNLGEGSLSGPQHHFLGGQSVGVGVDVEKSWYGLVRQQDALLQSILKKEEFEQTNLDWHVSQSREAFRRAAALEQEHAVLLQELEQLRGQLAVPTVLLTQHEEQIASLEHEFSSRITSLETRISTLSTEVSQSSAKCVSVESELKKKTAEANDLVRAVADLQRRCVAAESEHTRLRGVAEAAEREQARVQDESRQTLVALQMQQDESQQRTLAAEELARVETEARQAAEARIAEVERVIKQAQDAVAKSEQRVRDCEAAAARVAEVHAVESKARSEAISSLETQRTLTQKRHEEAAARAAAVIAELTDKNAQLTTLIREHETALVAARQQCTQLERTLEERARAAASEHDAMRKKMESLTKERGERAGQADAVATATARLAQLEQQCTLLGGLQVEIRARHVAEVRALTEQLRAQEEECGALRAALTARTSECDKARAAAQEVEEENARLKAALKETSEALRTRNSELVETKSLLAGEETERAAATARAASVVTTAHAMEENLNDLRLAHTALEAELSETSARLASEQQQRIADDEAVASLERQLADMHAREEDLKRALAAAQAQMAAMPVLELVQGPQSDDGGLLILPPDAGVASTNQATLSNNSNTPRRPTRPVTRPPTAPRHRHCFPLPVPTA